MTGTECADWAGEDACDAESIRVERFCSMLRQTPLIAIATLVNSAFVAAVFWPFAPHSVLLGWIATLWALTGVSVILWLDMRRRPQPERISSKMFWMVTSLTLLRGLVWAAVMIHLLPLGEPIYKAFLAFVAGGMAAGAATTLATTPIAAHGFIVTILSPFAYLFAASGDSNEAVMAAMIGLFMAMMVVIAYTRNRDFVENVTIRNGRLALLNELERRAAALERSERRAAEAHERLADALESISEGFILYDENERLVLCNSRYREFYPLIRDILVPGTRMEDVVRTAVERGQIVDARDAPEEWIRWRLQQHRTGEGTHIQQLSDGRWLRASERKTKNGGIVGIRTDITEFKNIEAALRKNEAQLRHITDAMPVMIAYMDAEARHIFVNRIVCDWFRTTREEIIGKTMAETLPRDHWEAVRPYVEEVLSGKSVSFESTTTFRDGVTRTARRSYMPHLNDNGEVDGFFALVEDVTEQRRTEEQLRQAQKLEALGQLTGGIAHDFNNILGIILGNVELLEEALPDRPELAAHARTAMDATRRGSELTQRLLAFARKQALQPRPVDVGRLVGETTRLVRRLLEESVEIAVVEGEDVRAAMVDPGQLENALLNLCVNARDAMPAGGRLTIETANASIVAPTDEDIAPGDYVRITVTDTGSGIPSDVLAHVYDPFYTTKKGGKGTGLGLSMVYGFVKQSGGHINIETEIGRGTSIEIYLPAAAEETGQSAAEPAEPVDAPTGTETIMVVEDNADMRDVAVSLIESLGYNVIVAEDGPKALEKIRSEPDIDLLFTDVVMPGGLSGIELSKRARELRPGLRVLYTSGYADSAVRENGGLDGNAHFIHKPYRKSELAKKLRAALGRDPSRAAALPDAYSRGRRPSGS